MSQGYFYIAIGDEKCLAEAEVSTRSLKRVQDKLGVSIVTNQASSIQCSELYEHIIKVDGTNPNSNNPMFVHWMKPEYINSSPYDKTFFVDTDTYFCLDCNELFQLLDYFDICMCTDFANKQTQPCFKNNKVFSCYRPYNSGVILFNKCAKTALLFQKWKHNYHNTIGSRPVEKKKRKIFDQRPLAMAVLSTADVKIYTLPNIYNVRAAKSGIYGKTRILHFRPQHLKATYEEIEKVVNKTGDFRIWNPKKCECVTI